MTVSDSVNDIDLEFVAVCERWVPADATATIGASVFCSFDLPYREGGDTSYYYIDELTIEVEETSTPTDELELRNANLLGPGSGASEAPSYLGNLEMLVWETIPASTAFELLLQDDPAGDNYHEDSFPSDDYVAEFSEISSFDRESENKPAQSDVKLTFESDGGFEEPGDYEFKATVSGSVRYVGGTTYKVGDFEDTVGFFFQVEDGSRGGGRCLE